MLILDEPTNHLDIEAREALVEAINEFSGAIVIVSHDWHLLSLVAERLWLVADGTVKPFDGDLDDYRRMVLAPTASESEATKDRRQSAPRDAAPRRRAPPRARATAPRVERGRARGDRSHHAQNRARPAHCRSGDLCRRRRCLGIAARAGLACRRARAKPRHAGLPPPRRSRKLTRINAPALLIRRDCEGRSNPGAAIVALDCFALIPSLSRDARNDAK